MLCMAAFTSCLQDRLHQLQIRLAHLLHHDTAALLELAAADADSAEGQPSGSGSSSASQLLPDALLWKQHQQQFHTMRNEGAQLTCMLAYAVRPRCMLLP